MASWCALACAFAVRYRRHSGAPRAEQSAAQTSKMVGIFEGHEDVGTVLHPGSVEYDAAKGSYTIAGSGENMWFARDAFQFAWKKVSGDVTLTADISFIGKGVNEHRKAVLMVRQSLDADSAYADVALHGNGLTSLQYRDGARARPRMKSRRMYRLPSGCGLRSAAHTSRCRWRAQTANFIWRAVPRELH